MGHEIVSYMEHKEQNVVCQNCKSNFVIEPEDFSFYEKIKVPPPTFCPECRLKQRYAVRSQTSLYKRDCDMCIKSIVSMYAPEKPFPVYCRDCFNADSWDATEYGQDIDFTRSFFEQFHNLMQKVPRIALIGTNKVNSDYSNHCADVKNCYLCFSIGASENCFYLGPMCVKDKNCVSSSVVRSSEWCYMLVDCEQCYKTSFAQNCASCIDSTFLFDCRNCQNCLGCVNLRNKNYCILNIQYTKEQFLKKKQELALDTFEGFENFRKEFEKLKLSLPHKYSTIDNAQNSTGDNIVNSRNCNNCFSVVGGENTKYGYICNFPKDSFDISNTYPSTELSYFSMAPINSNRAFFSYFVYSNCFDIWYSDNCYNANNCFGSISLKNKSYCILNKQYSKEEYEIIIEKLRTHMINAPYIDKEGREYRFGDFFPIENSPFSYNETMLQELFPVSKNEATDLGYSWREPDEKSYSVSISANDLGVKIFELGENITKETIECEHQGKCIHNCTKAFRVLPEEFQIYKTLGVPIPKSCPNCRYAERMAMRNPFKLWHRKCMKENCSNEFETPYDPKRPEIVYCEKCYQQEVY